jgi:hypothetical protein
MEDSIFIAQVIRALESERYFLIRNLPTPYKLGLTYHQVNTLLENVKVFGIEKAMDVAYTDFAAWTFTEHGCFKKA